MPNKIVDIESIADLHVLYGYPKPRHPLITVVDLGKVDRSALIGSGETFYRPCFYTIFFKMTKGSLRYGQSHYDFDEGSMMFTAPFQVVAVNPERTAEGWGLFFHPDLLNRSELGRKMGSYSFFQYDSNEALHVSEEEKQIIDACVKNIEREYSLRIDKHTQGLIRNNLELLLNYCSRGYDRQFISREKVSNDVVQSFERLLMDHFSREDLIEVGLPDVGYFAGKLNLSPNYLSDLLKRYTGKTTQEHIHLELIEKAKSFLWGSERSISEIAFNLGFEHPSHFTKVFKAKTGLSPKEFRVGKGEH